VLEVHPDLVVVPLGVGALELGHTWEDIAELKAQDAIL
jgi:hypothetical protein